MRNIIIEFKLNFIRTEDISNEPNPTKEEINNFATGFNKFGNPRYIDFVRYMDMIELMELQIEDITVENCKYNGNGIIELNLNIITDLTKNDIIQSIMSDNLEEGLWETEPGDCAVFPVRSSVFKNTPKELGVLECRNEENIKVLIL